MTTKKTTGVRKNRNTGHEFKKTKATFAKVGKRYQFIARKVIK